MTQETEFYVQALWDEEANVYYGRSNIKGLHIETETLEEFWDLVDHFTPELIFCNHFQKKTPKISPPNSMKVFSFTPPTAEERLPKMA